MQPELETRVANKAEETGDGTVTAGTPVVVTTACKGVFFGYLQNSVDEKRVAILKSARNAHYWVCTNGILELGESGPKKGSRVGSRADLVLTDVTAVIACTEAAVTAWEAAKWGN